MKEMKHLIETQQEEKVKKTRKMKKVDNGGKIIIKKRDRK